jgi:Protein of unknown function (DUF2637)
MNTDRLIRGSTAAVVTAVAGFAAVVSYSHIYDLGRAHGQSGTAARLLPLSVDGLILAASLVMLHEARNKRPAPALSRCMLWLGIAATVGANVAYGSGFGLLGMVISAWPAIGFIGSVEMVMVMVRKGRPAPVTVPVPDQVTVVPALTNLAGIADEAAVLAYRASVAGGNPLSERALADRFGITRPRARKLRTEVAAESNGHVMEWATT